MADSDTSSPILRYNLIAQVVEYFNGSDYYPVATTGSGVSSLNTLTGAVVLAAGSNITLTPSGNTVTIASSTSGITQLTGDVTAGPGSGSQAATLATVNSNVGSFTKANITVDAKGRITAAANGSGGPSFTPLVYFQITSDETTTSTSYVGTNLQHTFAMADPTHRVKVTVNGNSRIDAGNEEIRMTLEVDAVDQAPGPVGFQQAATEVASISNQPINPVSFSFVYSPGDTVSHNYRVYIKSAGGGSVHFPFNSGRLILEEII